MLVRPWARAFWIIRRRLASTGHALEHEHNQANGKQQKEKSSHENNDEKGL